MLAHPHYAAEDQQEDELLEGVVIERPEKLRADESSEGTYSSKELPHESVLEAPQLSGW